MRVGAQARIREAIQAAKREARVIRALILDRVIDAERIVRIVVVERMREVRTTPATGSRHRGEIVDHGVILATECYRAELRRRDTGESLTSELTAARVRIRDRLGRTLTCRTIAHAETAFQREDCLHAAAEVFRTPEAPTATVDVAARQAECSSAALGKIRSSFIAHI